MLGVLSLLVGVQLVGTGFIDALEIGEACLLVVELRDIGRVGEVLVEFGPEGTTFAKPVTITIPFDPELAALCDAGWPADADRDLPAVAAAAAVARRLFEDPSEDRETQP